jgi:hypothetical protein
MENHVVASLQAEMQTRVLLNTNQVHLARLEVICFVTFLAVSYINSVF